VSTTGHHALPERIQELEAEADALTLRLSGLSYRRIADEQGCSVSAAHDRVQRALKAYVPQEDVDQLRKIEGERLEAAIGAVLRVLSHEQATSKQILEAATTLARLQERKAKLYGLDTPVTQKLEVAVHDGDLADLDAALEQWSSQERAVE
jgi:DNA-binding Lrp family transcriptional regulator